MGYRCSLLAVKGASMNELASKLGLERSGEFNEWEEFPGFNGVVGNDGWAVVIAGGMEYTDHFTAAHAREHSLGATALFFWCTSTSMTTEVAVFEDGEKQWSVRYTGVEGDSSGVLTPPGSFAKTASGG